MRNMILDGIDQQTLPTLLPLVRQALEQHGDKLRPALASASR
jgi:hypothetical protein